MKKLKLKSLKNLFKLLNEFIEFVYEWNLLINYY
jgi:hypothetical protein